jgi:hypothetical protein
MYPSFDSALIPSEKILDVYSLAFHRLASIWDELMVEDEIEYLQEYEEYTNVCNKKIEYNAQTDADIASLNQYTKNLKEWKSQPFWGTRKPKPVMPKPAAAHASYVYYDTSEFWHLVYPRVSLHDYLDIPHKRTHWQNLKQKFETMISVATESKDVYMTQDQFNDMQRVHRAEWVPEKYRYILEDPKG